MSNELGNNNGDGDTNIAIASHNQFKTPAGGATHTEDVENCLAMFLVNIQRNKELLDVVEGFARQEEVIFMADLIMKIARIDDIGNKFTVELMTNPAEAPKLMKDLVQCAKEALSTFQFFKKINVIKNSFFEEFAVVIATKTMEDVRALKNSYENPRKRESGEGSTEAPSNKLGPEEGAILEHSNRDPISELLKEIHAGKSSIFEGSAVDVAGKTLDGGRDGTTTFDGPLKRDHGEGCSETPSNKLSAEELQQRVTIPVQTNQDPTSKLLEELCADKNPICEGLTVDVAEKTPDDEKAVNTTVNSSRKRESGESCSESPVNKLSPKELQQRATIPVQTNQG